MTKTFRRLHNAKSKTVENGLVSIESVVQVKYYDPNLSGISLVSEKAVNSSWLQASVKRQ